MLALRDPVGAGFEAVDSSLDSTPRQSLMSLFGMGPDDDAVDARAHIAMRSIHNISHRRFDTATTTYFFDNLRYGLNEFTYAVRATTVGEFTLPPAQLEGLYTPDYVGRSTAIRLRVIAPPEPGSEDEGEADGEVQGEGEEVSEGGEGGSEAPPTEPAEAPSEPAAMPAQPAAASEGEGEGAQ